MPYIKDFSSLFEFDKLLIAVSHVGFFPGTSFVNENKINTRISIDGLVRTEIPDKLNNIRINRFKFMLLVNLLSTPYQVMINLSVVLLSVVHLVLLSLSGISVRTNLSFDI